MPTSYPASMYAASREYYRMSKKRIVAARYVRNSDPAKKDGDELKSQAGALKAYAEKMGYECPDELLYSDAMSAIKYPYWEREGIVKALDDGERGMYDVLLCTEFARVARKSSEQYAVMEYLKRFSIMVESMTEKFEDTAEGRLLHAVQGFLAEVEAEKIRIRTQRGKLYRAQRGLTAQGSTPVYGLIFVDGPEFKKQRYEPSDKVIAVIDGVEWTEVKVIRFCVESCLQGISSRQIAIALTRMGIPTQRNKGAWSYSTVIQILKNECYTGKGYNGKWTRDENGKRSQDTWIALPEGIYPQLITPDEYERIQRRLEMNTDLAIRNNRHPKESLMRGMVFCGICGCRLHFKGRNEIKKGRKTLEHPEYFCYKHTGHEDALNHHHTSIVAPILDTRVWEFALPYIKNPTSIREHLDSMRSQVVQRDYSSDLESEIERINKSINNLYRLAEALDTDDEDGMLTLQDRLLTLQRDKREKEKLLIGISSNEEKQEKLLAALERFEAWAHAQRQFLDDPCYEVSFDDKREALLILGAKATVWPSKGYEKRTHLELLPPDIQRFCEHGFPQPS